MKKTFSWILIIVFSLIVIILSSLVLIKPGITNINSGNAIKKFNTEEIVKEKNKITQKYLNLAKELDEKYVIKESELEKEYEDKESEIESKYTKQMLEAGWFEEQSKKNDEKSKLNREKSQKSINLFTQKHEEKNALSLLEDSEIDEISNHNSERFLLITKGVVKISCALLVMIVFFGWIFSQVNKVIKSRNYVKESWAQIEVFLKRRYDLIPNIVFAVKEYAKHESTTLENVIETRTKALQTQDKTKEIELNNTISKDINQILLLGESYPDLKANKSYLSLQEELKDTEDEIADARERYNSLVLRYQNVIKTIPTNIFAGILGYEEELFFSIDDDEKEAPKVNFDNK